MRFGSFERLRVSRNLLHCFACSPISDGATHSMDVLALATCSGGAGVYCVCPSLAAMAMAP